MKLTSSNTHQLVKNRSLVKCSDDPTVMYVFSGHPIDDYSGRELRGRYLMYSLTSNDYRQIRDSDLSEENWYLVESEKDALKDMGDAPAESYTGFLDKVKKVFG